MGKNKNKKNKQLAQSPVISQATPLSSPAIVPDSPLQVPSVINEDSPIESVVVRVDNCESIDKQAAQAVRKKEQEFLALLEEQKTKIQEARQDLEILLDKKEQALAELNKEKEIHAELKAKLEQQNEINKENNKEEEIQEEVKEEVKEKTQPWYKRLLRFFIYK
jgi:hypothetical protein